MTKVTHVEDAHGRTIQYEAVTGHVFKQHPATFDVRITDKEFFALHQHDAGRLEAALIMGAQALAASYSRLTPYLCVVTVTLRPEHAYPAMLEMVAHILRAHINLCLSEMGEAA